MCWVMPPASPATTLAWRILSSTRGLAVVDVTHDGDDRGADLAGLVVVVAVVEQRLELDLLLLARIDEQQVGAELEREQLHVLVGERHGGRDHLAVVEEELDRRRRRCGSASGPNSWADTPRSTTIVPSGTGASLRGVARDCGCSSSRSRRRRRLAATRWATLTARTAAATAGTGPPGRAPPGPPGPPGRAPPGPPDRRDRGHRRRRSHRVAPPGRAPPGHRCGSRAGGPSAAGRRRDRTGRTARPDGRGAAGSVAGGDIGRAGAVGGRRVRRGAGAPGVGRATGIRPGGDRRRRRPPGRR